MGIPYSKQINAAFEQVTPLVAAGFEVLQTTKDIAILLACIQVLTVGILALILVALFGLLLTMNPDLEYERQQLVTPTLKYVSSWLLSYGTTAKWLLRTFCFVAAVVFVVLMWYGFEAGSNVPGEDSNDSGEAKAGEEDGVKGEDKDKEDTNKDKDKDNEKEK